MKYTAQLIINGETVGLKDLPTPVLDELIKYFDNLKEVK